LFRSDGPARSCEAHGRAISRLAAPAGGLSRRASAQQSDAIVRRVILAHTNSAQPVCAPELERPTPRRAAPRRPLPRRLPSVRNQLDVANEFKWANLRDCARSSEISSAEAALASEISGRTGPRVGRRAGCASGRRASGHRGSSQARPTPSRAFAPPPVLINLLTTTDTTVERRRRPGRFPAATFNRTAPRTQARLSARPAGATFASDHKERLLTTICCPKRLPGRDWLEVWPRRPAEGQSAQARARTSRDQF
jgi:hypothetical protein